MPEADRTRWAVQYSTDFVMWSVYSGRATNANLRGAFHTFADAIAYADREARK